MDMQTENPGEGWMNGLDKIKHIIDALHSNQNQVLKKLASIEKAVTCVQEDTTWVREEVRVVHEIVERLAEHVSLLNDTVVDVEGAPIQKSPVVSAWGPWPGDAHGKGHGRGDTTTIAVDDSVDIRESEPSHIHAGHDADSAIFETQMFEHQTGLDDHMTGMEEEEEEAEWQEYDARCRRLSAPGYAPTHVGDDDDAQQPMETQIELTLGGMEGGSLASGMSTWSSYTTTVKEMRAPAPGDRDTIEGWVQSKRVRGSSTELGGDDRTEIMGTQLGTHVSLNLNMSPERVDTADGVTGRGRKFAGNGGGRGSKGGGRGSGRGSGRGKKIPNIHPRFRSTVYFQMGRTYKVCCLMVPNYVRGLGGYRVFSSVCANQITTVVCRRLSV
jgi:hypothetical protein